LEEKIDKCVNNEENILLENEKVEVVNGLSIIDNYKTEGLILWSRCECFEKGEQSKLFPSVSFKK
jgi:hypothetical protein